MRKLLLVCAVLVALGAGAAFWVFGTHDVPPAPAVAPPVATGEAPSIPEVPYVATDDATPPAPPAPPAAAPVWAPPPRPAATAEVSRPGRQSPRALLMQMRSADAVATRR